MSSRNYMIHRAVDILQELRASLNLEAGGELATNMADLYDYSSQQLVRANAQSRPELLDEVGNLIREIRSAWIQIPSLVGQKP
jgi:flagellar protein FliS